MARRRDTPEERALKRQLRTASRAEPTALDTSWMKYARCVLCDVRFVVNNYEDRRIRDTRIFKRWVCPWCMGKGGKENLQRLIIVENLVKNGKCLIFPIKTLEQMEKLDKTCKCAYHVARRLFGGNEVPIQEKT